MISEFYSDDELLAELSSFFDENERKSIDFKTYLGQIEDVDDSTFQVRINGRIFQFDKELCGVEEVEL